MDLSGVLEIAGRTDTGMVRQQNEDSVGESSELGAVVVADGMGGYASGEVASAIAVNTVLNYLHEKLPDTPPGQFDEETGFSLESIHCVKRSNALTKPSLMPPISTQITTAWAPQLLWAFFTIIALPLRTWAIHVFTGFAIIKWSA